MAIFISPEEEEFIVARQHIVLVVAMTLDIVSLALLIKHTPSLMAEFRKYLYLIQASCSIRNQGTWTILAGYCVGLLCKWGVPIQKMTGIAMLLLENVGIAIMLAVLFRHQAIVVDNDKLKLKPFIILIVFLGVAVFSHMFYSLYTQERKRSAATFRRLRKTVFVLIAQLLIPLNFTVVPGFLIFTGITFENTISFGKTKQVEEHIYEYADVKVVSIYIRRSLEIGYYANFVYVTPSFFTFLNPLVTVMSVG
ncbi:hypothetical protein PRIPAC_80781, partial [Pristionchus pacificus]|uniref:G protein-coupled receptor n=1 Tax=Pristionchus pacificus TaxID=54126 RepID=A0A2A6CL56_PRIPA